MEKDDFSSSGEDGSPPPVLVILKSHPPSGHSDCPETLLEVIEQEQSGEHRFLQLDVQPQ